MRIRNIINNRVPVHIRDYDETPYKSTHRSEKMGPDGVRDGNAATTSGPPV